MSDLGAAIGQALAATFLAFVLGAFALGALAMWGLPKLWHLVKPLIHTFTG